MSWQIVRTGHMGEGTRGRAVSATLNALEEGLPGQGMVLAQGVSVEAAARALG